MTELDAIRRADVILRRLRKEIDEIEKSISEINQSQRIVSGPLKYYYQSATEQQLQYNLTGMGIGTPMDSDKAKEVIDIKSDLVVQYKQLHSAIHDTLNSLMAQEPGIYRDILAERLAFCIEEAETILS
ncbi:MAG: hypothetical protein IJ203_13080 [Atopobiaceae bacterium]|nr:hypothetical protein [Atopobiaceae bacterium]